MTIEQILTMFGSLGTNLPALLTFVSAVFGAIQTFQGAVQTQPLRAIVALVQTISAAYTELQKSVPAIVTQPLPTAALMSELMTRHSSPVAVKLSAGDAMPPQQVAEATKLAVNAPAFDGHRIAGLAKFLQDHPALLQWIMLMFKLPAPV